MEKGVSFSMAQGKKILFQNALFQVKFLNYLRQFFLASATNNVQRLYYKLYVLWYAIDK